MKKTLKIALPLLTTLLSIFSNNANATYYYNPRISVWGLAGTQESGRGDVLLPFFSDQDDLLYADVQGNYTTEGNNSDNANYAGVGAGLRKFYNNNVYGAYLFVDRDETQLHNVFRVLSPGVEAFFPSWDLRLNGYLPVGQRNKTVDLFPADAGCTDCGINCATSQLIVFKGHQEFEERFATLEQAGPGGDAEVGYTFHHLNNTQVHAGVYYFNFNNPGNSWGAHNTNNITGVEARLEVPVNPVWSLTLLTSYDNYQRGAIVGGLRLNLIGAQQTTPYDMHSHMVDAIPRNLGSLKTGSGIPTVKSTKDEGLFLQRDNIYFFTSQGGSAFVNTAVSGTFENPLRNDQFSQSVVSQIGGNANLYFNSGNYVITGAGTPLNAIISLPSGDSLYGRTLDYRLSATGSARPVLLGGINLSQGNNTLDSIQLINSATSAGTTNLNLTALSIQNAQNVFLCNDNIVATATVDGNLQPGISNLATGINSNNSQVLIKNSSISADAVVTGIIQQTGGTTGGLNFAAGIGGNSTAVATPANFAGNNFNIINSTINGAVSAGTNGWDSFATGIGSNAANGGIANFNGNTFTISDSTINGNANTNIIGFSTGINFALGIGSGGAANFTNNTLNAQSTQINANVSVAQADSGVNSAVGIGTSGRNSFIGNNFSLANSNVTSTATAENNNGIGINISLGIGNDEFGTSFSNNIFNLVNTKVNSTASILTNNSGFENVALGIGNNSSFIFNNNVFNLSGSSVTANALVGGNNTSSINGNAAIGIGGFVDLGFTNNTFNLINSSVSAISSVNGNNDFFNVAVGAGEFLGTNFSQNTFNLNNTTISANSSVGGNNSVSNIAIGAGVGPFTTGFANNIFNITGITINSTATVNGNNLNAATNQATGVSLDGGGNKAVINQSTINSRAKVNGTNSGTNTAIGVQALSFGDQININNSTVNTTATATGPGANTATGQSGNVISVNTQYNTLP